MIDLSILITSNKPYDLFAKKIVDYISNCTTDCKYEIILCHTDMIEDNRVISIIDDKKIGNGYAINHAFNNCNGKYFQYLTDDNMLSGNIFDILNTFESSNFQKRNFQALTLQAGSNNLYTTVERSPSYPEPLLQTNSFCLLPDFYVACYPGMTRECVKRLGGYVFNPYLKYFYDWWLGAFLYLNGEPCIQSNDIKFFPLNDSKQNSIFDKITGKNETPYFGESYVNLYRLVKNYKYGYAYVYDTIDDYLTEEQILKAMQ